MGGENEADRLGRFGAYRELLDHLAFDSGDTLTFEVSGVPSNPSDNRSVVLITRIDLQLKLEPLKLQALSLDEETLTPGQTLYLCLGASLGGASDDFLFTPHKLSFMPVAGSAWLDTQIALTSHGNPTLARVVSAGIFLSVFNAIVAIVIQIGRVVFSSGRDALWTPTINKLFTRIHPRWDSPWLATLFLAIPSAALSFSSNLADLTSFSVLLIMLVYLVVALSALMSRVLLRDREHPYRMPLWPLPALLAVLGAGYLLVTLLYAASVRDIMIIIGLLALSVILYCISGRLSPVFQKL